MQELLNQCKDGWRCRFSSTCQTACLHSHVWRWGTIDRSWFQLTLFSWNHSFSLGHYLGRFAIHHFDFVYSVKIDAIIFNSFMLIDPEPCACPGGISHVQPTSHTKRKSIHRFASQLKRKKLEWLFENFRKQQCKETTREEEVGEGGGGRCSRLWGRGWTWGEGEVSILQTNLIL